MIERDFIMRMLQMFFEALAKLIEKKDVPGEEPDPSYIQERLYGMYEQFFHTPAIHFYHLSKEDMLDELLSNNYSERDILARVQMLSELLYQDAMVKNSTLEKYGLLEKSLYLFEYLNHHSNTFSWDRNQRILDIKKILT